MALNAYPISLLKNFARNGNQLIQDEGKIAGDFYAMRCEQLQNLTIELELLRGCHSNCVFRGLALHVTWVQLGNAVD